MSAFGGLGLLALGRLALKVSQFRNPRAMELQQVFSCEKSMIIFFNETMTR